LHDNQPTGQQSADHHSQAVRNAPGLKQGDALAYIIEDGQVVLAKRPRGCRGRADLPAESVLRFPGMGFPRGFGGFRRPL